MRIFVSYTPSDMRFVNELFGVLSQQRFRVVKSGAFLSEQAWHREISTCPVVLYILSKGSVNNEPCIAQWRYALENNKRLIVLKLDNVGVPDALGRANLIDYLDFEQIGRQIAQGIPSLIRDRYASEVTLRMLIAELADVQRVEEAKVAELEETLPTPPPPEDSPEPSRPLPPLKRLARHLRRLRYKEDES